jgi:small subunit ribosomal protein S4
MGKPKFSRKRYETPSHPWKEERIKNEDELVRKYGLKNKREVWKSETRLRKYRGEARRLLARVDSDDVQSKREIDQLLMHLTRMSILPPNSNLDDVLALENEKILSRRLQTQVYLKGLARTPKQARQLIIHGHIAVDGKKVTVPSYMVEKKEEDKISYTGNSPLNIAMHPERPQPKFQPGVKTTDKTEEKNKEEPKKVEEKPEKETKKKEESKEKSSKEEETEEKNRVKH